MPGNSTGFLITKIISKYCIINESLIVKTWLLSHKDGQPVMGHKLIVDDEGR